MKIILLVIIRIYWILIPKTFRRKCIFSQSCSNHVYHITKQQGFLKGVIALKFRIKNCNPYFDVYTVSGEKRMLLKTGTTVRSKDIAYHLLNENETSFTYNK